MAVFMVRVTPNEAIAVWNVIVHRYDEINYRKLWETIRSSLPELRASAIQLLDEYGPAAGGIG